MMVTMALTVETSDSAISALYARDLGPNSFGGQRADRHHTFHVSSGAP
jgi:hypothetical protein